MTDTPSRIGPPDPTPTETRHELDRMADDLADRFAGAFTPETVARFVVESYGLLAAQATVRTHLVALTYRFAKDRLTAHATAEGVTATTVPQVLFVCVHNAGRSQMAAALLRHHAFGKVAVRSAGTAPTGLLDPGSVTALRENGIDLTEAFPKPLTDEIVRAADVVITMGCGDTCTIYPGKRYLDWDVPDPVDQPLTIVRAIRDEIDSRVRRLIDDLAR